VFSFLNLDSLILSFDFDRTFIAFGSAWFSVVLVLLLGDPLDF